MPARLLPRWCLITSTGAPPDMTGQAQTSVWTDNRGVLWIDLSSMLGHTCRLSITGWGEGIACTSHLEDEVLELGLFESGGIPLSQLCQQPGAADWIGGIPEAVVEQLVRLERLYGNCQLATLSLLCRSTAATELFLSAPLLFFALLQSVRSGYLAAEKLLDLVAEKRTVLLRICGFPESRACLRLLKTLPAEQMMPADLETVSRFVSLEGWERVNHLCYVDVPILKLLTLHPLLLGSRLLHGYDGHWRWRRLHALCKDVLRMSGQLGAQQPDRRIGHCRNIHELIALHGRLTKKITRREVAEMEPVLFGPPPLQGNEDIQPVVDSVSLLEEAASQRNCVDIYQDDILEGHYYVYAVLKPERATLGVGLDVAGRWEITELYLKFNAAPSDATRAAVMAWFEAEMARRGDVRRRSLVG
jgi:hypothetical protein